MEKFIKTIIKQAGKITLDHFGENMGYKTKSSPVDFVTDADLKANKFLVDKIHKKYPDHHIHTEEMKKDINGGVDKFEWVIDPIDGTHNYLTGVPFWCIIISVLKNGELYMGAVYNPLSKNLFFAEAGKGAYLNDKKIKVNNKKEIKYSFGSFIVHDMGVKPKKYARALIRYKKTKNTVIYHYGNMEPACHVARGGMDFFMANAGWDHDYLAPALICREAGAKVTNSQGKEWARYDRDIIIATPKLHKKLLELFC